MTRTKKNIICILSASIDTHADDVGKLLARKGLLVIRLNSDNISPNKQIIFSGNNADPLRIIYHGKKYRLNQITSIWYRKPGNRLVEDENLKPKETLYYEYKRQEILHQFQGLMYEAERRGIFLVSKFLSIQKTRNKLFQLSVARNIGFKIPNTLITSDHNQIKNFILDCNDSCIIKTLDIGYVRYGKQEKSFYTYPLTLEIFNKYSQKEILNYPLFIQERIIKKYELRINVIGNKAYACKIDSQSNPNTACDFRMINPYQIPHSPFILPEKIKKMCFKLCLYSNLQFGAIDMAVTSSGEYVFFEINPNGQYLWIEKIINQKLSQAMADLLSNPQKNALN